MTKQASAAIFAGTQGTVGLGLGRRRVRRIAVRAAELGVTPTQLKTLAARGLRHRGDARRQKAEASSPRTGELRAG